LQRQFSNIIITHWITWNDTVFCYLAAAGYREMARVLRALAQAMTGFFYGKAVDFFLFGFVYYCLFTVYFCNGLILYGLLGGF
jgi:hypothetical protein